MALTNTENPQDSTQQEKQLPQDIPVVYIWFGKTVP